MSKFKKGFTLIELLAVVAIIGLLASIILASLSTARRKARDARRLADIKQIQLALELYADANGGAYPATLSLLATTYIPVEPKDPIAGASYKYAALLVGNSCVSYHLGANLEDKTNSALTGDVDNTGSGSPCPSSGVDFVGVANEVTCIAICDCSAGTADRFCYDIKP